MMRLAREYTALGVGILAAIFSITSWIILSALDLTLIYNDSMSHLNVARLVVDNLQPGMAQLGSVWLPMSHLLSLPFIWIDVLWQTGLAGSIVSMAAFVLGSVGIYKLTLLLADSKKAGVIAALAFILSLNMLYLQATPLTEALYAGIFIYTLLYFARYILHGSHRALIPLGIVSAIGVLTRYDAWFVAAVIGVLIIANELFIRRNAIKGMFGYASLYAFPIVFAALLWFGWNLLIFGDPLYSFTGPYSARAQQEVIEQSSGLITKYNAGTSAWAYLLSIFENVGIIVTALGAAGWLAYILGFRAVKTSLRIIIVIAASSVILFNILALYLGFSILNLPQLQWNPSGTEAGALFNVRYGVMALPMMAVGVGLLLTRVRLAHNIAHVVVLAALFVQAGLTCNSGIITIQDGLVGSSAFVNQDIAKELRARVLPSDKVVMSTSSYNAVAFESGLRLDTFIHEGVSSMWNGARTQPDKYARWIVVANGDVGEPLYESLIKNQNSAFLKKYKKVATGSYANLYELKLPR